MLRSRVFLSINFIWRFMATSRQLLSFLPPRPLCRAALLAAIICSNSSSETPISRSLWRRRSSLRLRSSSLRWRSRLRWTVTAAAAAASAATAASTQTKTGTENPSSPGEVSGFPWEMAPGAVWGPVSAEEPAAGSEASAPGSSHGVRGAAAGSVTGSEASAPGDSSGIRGISSSPVRFSR